MNPRPKYPGSFHLLHLFGIDVFIHWTWFVVAYIMLLRQPFGGGVLVNGLLYVSLFGIVLLHEFGHALACRSVGGKANLIVLWPLGGIAFVQPPVRPGAVLWSIAAGPLVNLILVPITFGLAIAADLAGGASGFPGLWHFASTLFGINLALLIFNMLPIYPLDGGQVLQSILWFFIGRAKSLRVTATIGLVCAGIGLVLAALSFEVMLFLIALFVGWQAINGLRTARLLEQQELRGERPPLQVVAVRRRGFGNP